MFAVERIKLNFQKPELFELENLSVRDQRVGGQQPESLEMVAVLSQELNGFYILPAVRDGQTDQILGLSSPVISHLVQVAQSTLSHLVSLVK